MQEIFTNPLLLCLVVSCLWGVTNPFLRAGTSEQEGGLVAQLSSLGKVKALVPYGLNQLGSLLFCYVLSARPLSLAAPVCNGAAFVFTALTAAALGEQVHHPGALYLGLSFCVVGLILVSTEVE
ncbi:unnamed protein product [Chrysoparadoxa australica]